MELEKARAIAEKIEAVLKPSCERIEIAGSIRRQKPFVGDIELLVVPKGLELDRLLYKLMAENVLAMRLNKRGSRTYGPKNKLMVHTPSGIGVDIFSSPSENWGMAFFVRTGPKEWNIRAMSRLHELSMQGHAYGGVTGADGEEINCPDEETVFRCLGWAYVPPEKRK